MILRLILGDQLNDKISSLTDIDANHDVILMCEVMEEATYVKHHKKKISFIFSAMRHFAIALKSKGYNVQYTELTDPENTGSFHGEMKRMTKTYKPTSIVVTEPSEYRVLQGMRKCEFGIPVDIRPDDRFLCDHADFEDWANGRKQLRMEYFYREMRKKYSILMDGDKPEGGNWNYDKQNRKPPKEGLHIPKHYISEPDEITRKVIDLVESRFSDHFGDLQPFHFAVTREQALQALN